MRTREPSTESFHARFSRCPFRGATPGVEPNSMVAGVGRGWEIHPRMGFEPVQLFRGQRLAISIRLKLRRAELPEQKRIRIGQLGHALRFGRADPVTGIVIDAQEYRFTARSCRLKAGRHFGSLPRFHTWIIYAG